MGPWVGNRLYVGKLSVVLIKPLSRDFFASICTITKKDKHITIFNIEQRPGLILSISLKIVYYKIMVQLKQMDVTI